MMTLFLSTSNLYMYGPNGGDDYGYHLARGYQKGSRRKPEPEIVIPRILKIPKVISGGRVAQWNRAWCCHGNPMKQKPPRTTVAFRILPGNRK